MNANTKAAHLALDEVLNDLQVIAWNTPGPGKGKLHPACVLLWDARRLIDQAAAELGEKE